MRAPALAPGATVAERFLVQPNPMYPVAELESVIAMPATSGVIFAVPAALGETRGTALVLAPSAAENSPWLRRFGEASTAFASGWIQLRGARRRRALDRGFTLSDHADWDGLLSAISATGAQRILATHGSTAPLVRWLRARALEAHAHPLRPPPTASTGP